MSIRSFGRRLSARLLHATCGLPALMRQREKIVPRAGGVVVEIGFGTGRNLPLYDPSKVTRLIGINPPDGLTEIADLDRLGPGIEAEIVLESAENMSLDTSLADTVVITYTMCTITDVASAISEMRRILKPSGKLLFCEHGRADSAATARWQDRLDPYWGLVAQGCHINRNPSELLTAGGFALEEGVQYPVKRVPSVLGFHHIGVARAD